MTTREQLNQGLTTCMGRARILEYAEVARRACLDRRSVRNLHEGTEVGTLIKIAAALDSPEKPCRVADLVAEVAP